MELNLTVIPQDQNSLIAGYMCPCGCRPKVGYQRGSSEQTDSCCCGNQFAVGPHAAGLLGGRPAHRHRVQTFVAPWGDHLQAAWALVENPSHSDGDAHGDGDEHHDQNHDDAGAGSSRPARDVIDPVCGMLVNVETASAKDLTSHYRGVDYYFCGKGCKLDFDEDPDRYLDPTYVPSM